MEKRQQGCGFNRNSICCIFGQEIRKVIPVLKKHNKALYDAIEQAKQEQAKKYKKKMSKNLDGSFMSTFLGNIERMLLEVIVKHFESKEIIVNNNCVLHRPCQFPSGFTSAGVCGSQSTVVMNDVQMSSMFRGCASFNQDLSTWCVTNVPTKPSGFDANSALVATNLPLWGTCPTPGSMIGNDNPIASDDAKGDSAADQVEMQEIALFPNPTTGIVQIDPVLEGSYKIFDAMGKTLEQGAIKAYYNFSEQPNGVYTLMLQTNKRTKYIKVVKK